MESWDLYDDATECWIPFPPVESANIEQAFRTQGVECYDIQSMIGHGVIDFLSMICDYDNDDDGQETCQLVRRFSSQATYQQTQWQWLEGDEWIRYSIHDSELMNICMQLGRMSTALHLRVSMTEMNSYAIDLSRSIQTNVDTDFTRDIRNVLVSSLSRMPVTRSIGPRIEVLHVAMSPVDERITSLVNACSKPTTLPTDQCPICLEVFVPKTINEALQLPRCSGHYFHKTCIQQFLCVKGKCPMCSTFYIFHTGNQPADGSMTVTRYPTGRFPLTGYESYGTILIKYAFPSGIQDPSHPNPGTAYAGTIRTALLPDNSQGNQVLELLQICFQRRLTFTIGTSVTTGRPNSIIWNGVHHKTNPSGGPEYYGYPDETYFVRVRDELRVKGIY